MITGTLERDRSCLHTSVPLMPGSIRSSSTMSAPARSNSARAEGPSVTTVASKPSLRSRNARGSARDSSSSTINTLVMGVCSFLSLVRSFVRLADAVRIGRNRHGERRPRAGLTPQPDGSIVVGCNMFDDREAEAGASGCPRSGFVDAEEPLEHPLLIGGGDAESPIRHGDLDVVAPAPTTDGNRG